MLSKEDFFDNVIYQSTDNIIKKQNIQKHFKQLESSVERFLDKVDLKLDDDTKVVRVKTKILGIRSGSSGNTKIEQQGVLDVIEKHVTSGQVFYSSEEETVKITKRMEQLIADLDIYLDSDADVLYDSLLSVESIGDNLYAKFSRLERRGNRKRVDNNPEVYLAHAVVKLPEIIHTGIYDDTSKEYNRQIRRRSQYVPAGPTAKSANPIKKWRNKSNAISNKFG